MPYINKYHNIFLKYCTVALCISEQKVICMWDIQYNSIQSFKAFEWMLIIYLIWWPLEFNLREHMQIDKAKQSKWIKTVWQHMHRIKETWRCEKTQLRQINKKNFKNISCVFISSVFLSMVPTCCQVVLSSFPCALSTLPFSLVAACWDFRPL